MAEIVDCIATIFDSSVGTVVRQFGYLWNHEKNIKNLKSEVEKLDGVREDISRAVAVAERNAQIVRKQVDNWQSNAEKIGAAATEIIEKYEEDAKKRCLIGLCPNPVSLYQGSRKASKKQIKIVLVWTEAAQFNGVADHTVGQVPATLSTKGYLTFDSRNSILEEIVKAMKEDTVNSIGVYGLGGIGKTTLAKQVASRVAEEKMFDDVVMAPVTETPNLQEIQGAIARSLDLKFEGSSVAERAGELYKRMKEKKILVILDDLWNKLDLEEVGIPFGPEHKGCKLLLTSRSRDVLLPMGTNKDFNVEALGENEAWSLFAEKTVNVIKDPAFLSIGKEVAKRCGGLPVLIVTVAASLSSRPSLPAWKDALNQLKTMNNNKEVHEIVNSAIELISVQHLEKTHKRLFLFCGLLGSGVPIDNLLKYSVGWDFFEERVGRVEDVRNKLHALILDLKASCLLLDGDNEDTIKIHDVVRSVAISIASKDLNTFLVGDNGIELNSRPQEDMLKRCTALVFHVSSNPPCLPEWLECPLLELFVLSGISEDFSLTTLDTFFERTRILKVLDMSEMSFKTLPPSISFLGNLQTLRLDDCWNLKDISIVRELKKLQVLSFSGSSIEELPREIGQLSELRLLDLSYCYELKIIPAGLIESLSKLEELYMRQSFNRWEAEGCLSSSGTSNVCLTELKHLPNLRSLEIEVPNAQLSKDLNFENLEKYAIVVGDDPAGITEMAFDKKGISRKIGLNLDTISLNHNLQLGVKILLKRAESVCLQELKGIKSVINEVDRDGLPELKHLTVGSNSDIQFIVNVDTEQQRAFPALESLHFYHLLKLEKICNGRLVENSFSKLTDLKVKSCNRLESLFSFSTAMGLLCLQKFKVYDCSILKGIVAKSRDDVVGEKIEFVKLRKLSLEGLPRLMSFYSSVKEKQKYMETGAQSEEIVSEEEEPSSSMSFFKEVSFPSLEELTLSEIANLTEIWNHKLLEKSYLSLKSLVVKNCACLVNVFSFNLLQLSRNLEVLHISNCAELEEVFVVPEELGIDERNGLVSQLVELTLIDLPKLRCMWSNYHPSVLSFKNLKKLRVKNCDNLKYLFTPSITMGLVQLQELRIKSCATMKEIVVREEGETIDAVIFPQLSYLQLKDLPNLTTFYYGDEEMGSNENIAKQSLFNEKVN